MKEIDELEGRELDAAVAERVMGWTVQRRNTGNLMAILPDDSRVCIEHVNGVRPATLWNPSEDIAAAFQVLEHWKGDYILRRRNDTAFSCELFQPSQEFLAWASTLPLAICRAALKGSPER